MTVFFQLAFQSHCLPAPLPSSWPHRASSDIMHRRPLRSRTLFCNPLHNTKAKATWNPLERARRASVAAITSNSPSSSPPSPVTSTTAPATPAVPVAPVTRGARGASMHRAFQLQSDHAPSGDQPSAIRFLADNLRLHRRFQTLHGVTGSGKTFIMANLIAATNRPTLVLAPNKTLAAQLYSEFARYFPLNAVEFFVSHFKYYQPEAYLPSSDKYIAKASVVDKHIDRLRHAATKSLFERSDTIVVASVSSIYGLGLPSEYLHASFPVRLHHQFGDGPSHLAHLLSQLTYVEETFDKVCSTRGLFHIAEHVVHLSPPWEPEGTVYRISFDGHFVVALDSVNTVSDTTLAQGPELVIYPAKHFVTPKHRLEDAISAIELETKQSVAHFLDQGKVLEASRLQERVAADIDMMRKVGFCQGMENYSLYLSDRKTSDPPETLIDYLPKTGDWLLLIDESHVTVPQLSAMHAGNAARKRKLIHHGFRLPSAIENRPLSEHEFWAKAAQTVFVSATPGPFELQRSAPGGVVEAVIRPTGVVDPSVEVVRTRGQLEHLTSTLATVVANGGKAIVTTITKRFAEDVADCLASKAPVPGVLDRKLRVSFLHSGIDSVGRMQVLEAMRDGSSSGPMLSVGDRDDDSCNEGIPSLDVVVGVNLLREGIDLPAVQLVAILDADSEGFLRGETALIQTIGRAARNVNGHVIMYADTMTGAMQRAMAETKRRRRLQMAFNRLHELDATPVGGARVDDGDEWSILNRIRKLSLLDGDRLAERKMIGGLTSHLPAVSGHSRIVDGDLHRVHGIDVGNADEVRRRMLEAAEKQDFEMAALLRDRLSLIKSNSP